MSAPSSRGRIVTVSTNAITAAAHCIVSGGVVAIPTETCYGLAADATNAAAVAHVFRIKGRAADAALSVLVADLEMAAHIALLSDAARAVVAKNWRGASPATFVLPAAPGVLAAGLTGGKNTVGMRRSADAIASAIVAQVGRPITATSANVSGEMPARTARAAAIPGVALVVDGGPRCAPVSAVIAVAADGETTILRASV